MARKIADVLLQLFVLGITGFLLFVLVDLRDRYDQKITAPGSNRTDGRNLALMPGLPSHAEAGAEHARHESAKPVSTDAAGNTNQGMSVALSADGSTAIVGGPGPNNVDRDRSPSRGPAGAAWIFIRRGGRVRIRQGADHRRKAQSRREPQGHREDVTAIATALARRRVCQRESKHVPQA